MSFIVELRSYLLEVLVAPLLEAFEHLFDALGTLAGAVVHAALHQTLERAHDAVVGKEIVRDFVHHLVGLDLERLLGAIPT